MGPGVVKKGWPAQHVGGFAQDEDWVQRLRENSFGLHRAWYAPPPDGKREPVSLIPWLLFNRGMWERLAERMSSDEDTLNVRVGRSGGGGWLVSMTLTEEHEVLRVDAVDEDAEAAPSPSAFEGLEEGPLPPRVPASMAAGRQRRLVAAAALVVLSAAASLGLYRLVAPGGSEAQEAARIASMLGAAEQRKRELADELQYLQGRGVGAAAAGDLLRGAVLAGAKVELRGLTVRWSGSSPPASLDCGERDDEGWRDCTWGVESG